MIRWQNVFLKGHTVSELLSIASLTEGHVCNYTGPEVWSAGGNVLRPGISRRGKAQVGMLGPLAGSGVGTFWPTPSPYRFSHPHIYTCPRTVFLFGKKGRRDEDPSEFAYVCLHV